MRFTLLIFLISTCFLSRAQKTIQYANATYEPEIKTVRLEGLILEFDDLRDRQEYYYYKLIHCTYDWQKSTLVDLDFMQDYNEFRVNDIAYSNNEGIPYVHYQIQIPPVKLAGNYLVVVYRDGNERDLVLTHRIIIPNNKVVLKTDNQLAGVGNLFTSNQQLNFTINYSGFEILNPLGTVHVVILQNHRWDNARNDVKPSFVREDRSELEYRFFDQRQQFNGGNEFRFVDFRSLNSPGQNTETIDKSSQPFLLTVQPDRSRAQEVYSQYNDLNGEYVIQNYDRGGNAAINSDYARVQFTLTSSEPVRGPVYVVGAFNNWARTEENRMTYNAAQKAYQRTLLLKQGRYDYQYIAEDNSVNSFEGSHFQTENRYEILVYYRPFRPNADILIGYFDVPVNPR